MPTSTPAYRAGQLARQRAAKRAAEREFEEDESGRHYGANLEWPELRRRILAQGGIGPSPDWDREDYPGDLYREHGKPPDLIANETTLGRADRTPWQEGDHSTDDAMIRYLKRSKEEWDDAPASVRARHTIALSAAELGRRRAADEQRRHAAVQAFGGTGRLAREQSAHNERIAAMVKAARAARAAKFKHPAIGFYTDSEDRVRPITAPRKAGRVYALRRGHPRL